MTTTEIKTITATFHPQAWVNAPAEMLMDVEPKGPTTWNVTRYILTLPAPTVRALRDNNYSSDDLRHASSAPRWIKDWAGPFYVEVEESLCDFFDVADISAITEELLAQKRAECEAYKPKVTLRDMVVWAKDRLVDDITQYIEDFNYAGNFAMRTEAEQKELADNLHRLTNLLLLPDDSYYSLSKLREANYWNGAEDTYWETALPPDDYAGQ